jgi:hypothetical protein
VEELQPVAPDLGWTEATALVDALVEALAHRLVDLGAGRAEPSPLPVVTGAVGGADAEPDHASCRAAAARLRRVAPVLLDGGPGYAGDAGAVMTDLADLLDRLADRTRRGRLQRSDKAVVLRRLHALRRRLHPLGPGPTVWA